MKASKQTDHCPCDSGLPYIQCCQPLHLGQPAPCAQALMRSRYSAYVLQLTQYLIQTWHPDTRPSDLDLTQDHTQWLGLTIIRAENTSLDTAIVEFVARYKVGGNRAERMHETSQFSYSDAWYYVTGQVK
ncbi:MAG: YchJ family metal-binding protein [Methylophilus sp.]|nr:YchJ family metal-binding protein [Methylophilus sp.]